MKLLHLPAHNSTELHAALVRALAELPSHLRRTLTWDQGTEMAKHLDVTTDTGTRIYFRLPGLELALACDIRIASRAATFGLAEVALGLTPGSGGTQRLTRLVGAGWTMHMTLIGRPLNADQAYDIGLVTQLHEPSDPMPAAVELAAQPENHPRLAYTSSREAIRRSLDFDQATSIEFERKLFTLCLSTASHEPEQMHSFRASPAADSANLC